MDLPASTLLCKMRPSLLWIVSMWFSTHSVSSLLVFKLMMEVSVVWSTSPGQNNWVLLWKYGWVGLLSLLRDTLSRREWQQTWVVIETDLPLLPWTPIFQIGWCCHQCSSLFSWRIFCPLVHCPMSGDTDIPICSLSHVGTLSNLVSSLFSTWYNNKQEVVFHLVNSRITSGSAWWHSGIIGKSIPLSLEPAWPIYSEILSDKREKMSSSGKRWQGYVHPS